MTNIFNSECGDVAGAVRLVVFIAAHQSGNRLNRTRPDNSSNAYVTALNCFYEAQ